MNDDTKDCDGHHNEKHKSSILEPRLFNTRNDVAGLSTIRADTISPNTQLQGGKPMKQKYNYWFGWLFGIAAYSCVATEESVNFNDVLPDLLPKIFEYAVTPELKEGKLLKLAAVCKTWEIVVKGDRKYIFKKSIDEAIKEVFPGNEEDFRRFLNGRLIYKADNDIDNIELRIGDLDNPLNGTFDLSKCGDIRKNLSISTGYRIEKKHENARKIEIWLTPKFLIERKKNTDINHFQAIYDKFNNHGSVGIFWTWGNWSDMNSYDYLIPENLEKISNINLYEHYRCRNYSVGSSYEDKYNGRIPEGLKGGGMRYHFVSCHGYFENLYMHEFYVNFG